MIMVRLQLLKYILDLRLDKEIYFETLCHVSLHNWLDFSHDNGLINMQSLNNFPGVAKSPCGVRWELKAYDVLHITIQKLIYTDYLHHFIDHSIAFVEFDSIFVSIIDA